jgi:hypothetical protein
MQGGIFVLDGGLGVLEYNEILALRCFMWVS